MESTIARQLGNRVEQRARDWCVVVEHTLETESSVIAFGRRGSQPVVLKVLKQPGDEWHSGEILAAFDGKGVVRVYEYVEGAVLLERLSPGNSLVSMALEGRDDEATQILAVVIQKMSALESATTWATVQDWAEGFDRYSASGDDQIPRDLVEKGRRVYSRLCGSQGCTRLLHGDLQHYNVLFDSDRGWVAIDPKGIVGEVEYEIGAAPPESIRTTGTVRLVGHGRAKAQAFCVKSESRLQTSVGLGFCSGCLIGYLVGRGRIRSRRQESLPRVSRGDPTKLESHSDA